MMRETCRQLTTNDSRLSSAQDSIDEDFNDYPSVVLKERSLRPISHPSFFAEEEMRKHTIRVSRRAGRHRLVSREQDDAVMNANARIPCNCILSMLMNSMSCCKKLVYDSKNESPTAYTRAKQTPSKERESDECIISCDASTRHIL
jgi:hypothetical protein